MRRVLVTGANKGIGLAIATGILREHQDTFVLLGARSTERGRAALERIVREQPAFQERTTLLELDVSQDDSVARAAETVANSLGHSSSLYGVVNNAGVGGDGRSLEQVLQVNTFGVHRVCEGFVPLLDRQGGRIVNVTSAAGPNFVAKCSPEIQKFFLDPHTDWEALTRLMNECLAMDGDPAAFARRGLSDGEAYGLSKACSNTYTQHLATRHPGLHINACTPGFIETDMTRPYAAGSGKSPAELGMKSPADGARSPLFLLFGDLVGNGRYYGSDGKRSPLNRYRSPGDPEYTGE